MAGGNSVNRMSPRQRMINLMYIVLTAMLALNVSSDVLNGFSQVHAGLARTNRTMSTKNQIQFEYLKGLYEQNPTKAGPWYNKGVELRTISNELFTKIDTLKMAIAHQADGVNGDYKNLINQDDLEAAAAVMLNPATKKGAALKKQIDEYREFVSALIPDSTRRATVMEMLSTKATPKPGTVGPVTWEDLHFDNMPAIASITLLEKIQNDVRQAESEVLTHLINNVDIGDMRVNQLSAYVIPTTTMLMRGGKYHADIVLAAIDTTKRPSIYVNGAKLQGGVYEFTASALGNHQYSGYIEVPMPDGSVQKHNFTSSYTVIEPMATISPTMMNVLYAGIDNPISISVPGVPMTGVNASMTNGTLTRNGDTWIARPGKIGTEAVISVTAELDGRPTNVGSMTFRVRKLPDPTAYIPLKGGEGGSVHYKGTPKRISKAQLMSANGLGAAIDDDILNVTYTVVSFSTIFFDSMGNAIPETSNGASFSQRQKDKFKDLKPGKSFFISNIKATGPDGVTRDISPMEVGLN